MARQRHHRLATKMVFPGPAVVGAWVARAAGHSAANLAKRRAEVPDCQWAWDRGFLKVTAEREHLVVLERRDAREWHQAPRLQDEPPMAAHQPAQPTALRALRVEWVSQPVGAQRALLRPARWQAREPEPWAQLLVRQAPQPERP
jgi:hypothetical protein